MKKTYLMFVAFTAFFFLSGAVLGAVIEVFPTNTSADVTNVQAAVDSASPGDVILLHAKDAAGIYRTYNFNSIPHRGIQISTPNLIIR